VRFAVKVQRGREVRREDVLDLRREMGSQSAQIGVIVSPGDATREARSEVAVSGAPLVTLLCADALGEQLMERGIGVRTRTVTYVELDESLRGGREEGGRESREERRERRERERREWREKRQRERAEKREARSAEGEVAPARSEPETAPAVEEAVAVAEPPAPPAESDTPPGGETQ
jgi:hypothetical protein